MSLGTLYTNSKIRGLPAKAIIVHYGLDVKVVETEDAKHKKVFPLQKYPAFIGPKGFKLTESIAITIYCMYSNSNLAIGALLT